MIGLHGFRKYSTALIALSLFLAPQETAASKTFSSSDVEGDYRYVGLAGDVFVDGDGEIYSGVGTATFTASTKAVAVYDTLQLMNNTDSVSIHTASGTFSVTDYGELHVYLTPDGAGANEASEEHVGSLSDTRLGGLFVVTAASEFNLVIGMKNFASVAGWDSTTLKNADWRGIDISLTNKPPSFDFGFDSTTFYGPSDSQFRFSFWEPGRAAQINQYGGFYDVASNGLLTETSMSDIAGNNPVTTLGWMGPDSQVLIYADVGESSIVNMGVLLKRPTTDTKFDTVTLYGSYTTVVLSEDSDPNNYAPKLSSYYASLTFDGQGNGQILLPGDTENGEPEFVAQDFTYAVDDKAGTAQITVMAEDGKFGVRAVFNDSRTILVGALVDTLVSGETQPSDLERMAFIAVLDPSVIEETIDITVEDSIDLSSAEGEAEVDFDPGAFNEAGVKMRASVLSDSSDELSDVKNLADDIEAEQSRMFEGIDLTPNKGADKINNEAIEVVMTFNLKELQKVGIDTTPGGTYSSFDPMIMEKDTTGNEVWKRVPYDSITQTSDIDPGDETFTVRFHPPHFSRYSVSARRADTTVNMKSDSGTNGAIKNAKILLDTGQAYIKTLTPRNQMLIQDSKGIAAFADPKAAGCTVNVGVPLRGDSLILWVRSNAKDANIGLSGADSRLTSVGGADETAAAKKFGFPSSDTGIRGYRNLVIYDVKFRDTKGADMTDLSSGANGTRYKYYIEFQLSDDQVNAMIAAGAGDTSSDSFYLYSSATLSGAYTPLCKMTYSAALSGVNKRVYRSCQLDSASAKAIGLYSTDAAAAAAAALTVQGPGTCLFTRLFPSHPSFLYGVRGIRDWMLRAACGRLWVAWYYSLHD